MKVLEFNTQELEGSKKMVLDFSWILSQAVFLPLTKYGKKSRFIESQYCPIKIQKNIITYLNKIFTKLVGIDLKYG